MDNNYLFLAMQTGGQLTPEQLQRAQQMGQLPQMNMGAGLNDIQRMNMSEAQHYNMFKKGGEQEEIDQQYLSPYTQYNQRVSEFLENLKSTAMDALQDEMVNVNDDYAQEADQIETEQAGYGMSTSKPTVNPQGLAAVDAWTKAAQNTKDLTKPLAETAGLASGLKGYWGDQAAYEANPYNSQWNPTRLTVTDQATGEKTVTRARNGFFQPGGQTGWERQMFQGTPAAQPVQSQGQPGDLLRVRPQASQYDAQTLANARAMGWGDDVAGYAASNWQPHPSMLPTTTKKKTGKPSATTPTATANTTATNTAPTGTIVVKNADGTESSISPEEAARRKAEAETKATSETGKGFQEGDVVKADGSVWRNGVMISDGKGTKSENSSLQSRNGEIDYLGMLTNPMGNAGGIYSTDRNGNPVPMAFYDPDMRLNSMTADYRNNAASWFRKNKRPGQLKSLSFDFTNGNQSPATQVPSITGVNTPVSSTGVTLAPGVTRPDLMPKDQSPENDFATWLLPQEQAQPPLLPGQTFAQPAPVVLNTNTNTTNGPIMTGPNVAPAMVGPNAGPAAQPAAMSPRQERKQIRQEGKEERRKMIEEANRKAIEQIQNAAKGYAHGGSLPKAQPGQEVLGLTPNPQMDMSWAPVTQTGVQMSQDFNKQKYGEPLTVDTTGDKYTAKYDKNKKNNPFFAPAVLAGLNTIAGATQNADARTKEKQLRNKLSYDQIYTANPETSGSRGDWTFNEGYMRPNDMVPTQFTGNGRQMQWGGAYAEGDELYLDEDAIQAFLAAGGQLDYLD